MQATTYTAAFVRAVALARTASSNTGPEADTATAMLAKHVAKHKLDLAAVIARAALPDTATDNAGKAGVVTTAKPKAERKAKPEQAAKPDRSAERQAAHDATREARRLAGEAVRAYYSTGPSLPFKAAADTFAPLRLDKAPKRATQRQAALLASMLCADGNNINADGTFKRGGFILDGKAVQPETGCLSDALGRVVSYVSGPISGNGQRDTVLRLDLAKAATEIRELIGGSLASVALKRIATLQRQATATAKA